MLFKVWKSRIHSLKTLRYWLLSFRARGLVVRELVSDAETNPGEHMKKKKMNKNMLERVVALKKQFDGIKSDTEDFLIAVKKLSNEGADEAKEMIDAAKSNWQSIVSAFENSAIKKFFSKSKKKSPVAKSKKPGKKKSKKSS